MVLLSTACLFEVFNTFYRRVVQNSRRVDTPQFFLDYFDVSGDYKHISFLLGNSFFIIGLGLVVCSEAGSLGVRFIYHYINHDN